MLANEASSQGRSWHTCLAALQDNADIQPSSTLTVERRLALLGCS